MEQRKWAIRFRYIPPEDYSTPYMYLPVGETCLIADSASDAWKRFLKGAFPHQRDHLQQLSIEECEV